MTFNEQDDAVFVLDEQNYPPFEERLLGALRKNHDGYYEFHAGRKVVMNCKQCRLLAMKLSELNTEKRNA